jgi:hypothetical protein
LVVNSTIRCRIHRINFVALGTIFAARGSGTSLMAFIMTHSINIAPDLGPLRDTGTGIGVAVITKNSKKLALSLWNEY